VEGEGDRRGSDEFLTMKKRIAAACGNVTRTKAVFEAYCHKAELLRQKTRQESTEAFHANQVGPRFGRRAARRQQRSAGQEDGRPQPTEAKVRRRAMAWKFDQDRYQQEREENKPVGRRLRILQVRGGRHRPLRGRAVPRGRPAELRRGEAAQGRSERASM
jgi:hypothetical protein